MWWQSIGIKFAVHLFSSSLVISSSNTASPFLSTLPSGLVRNFRELKQQAMARPATGLQKNHTILQHVPQNYKIVS
jgi:hypothetical protein